MFSSTNNSVSVNPFLPSAPLPPSFIFNHFDDPPLTTHNFSLPSANNTMVNNHSKMGPLSNNKPSLKKNRHSKIRTAQGLRDRRVRLSIGVARKFFDLQDTLGFDKASKTLEWLLTKSKTSIMELTVNNGSGGGEEVVDNNGGPARTNKLRKGAIHNHSKELREKARERARERTRAKLCTRKTQSPHTCFQPLPNPASRADIIEESIVIKRKLKPPVSNFADHQNFVTSKDVTTIITNNCLPSLPQSWDISSAITCSSFYAMINDNLSTEIQLYDKPWEAHNNNQSLH